MKIKNKIKWVVFCLALLYGGHLLLMQAVEKRLREGNTVAFEEWTPEAALGALQVEAPSGLQAAVPFHEVQAFDDEALHWGTTGSDFAAGLLVFDANGDGRLDVYFCQNGDNWVRPTNAEGVLLDQPRKTHNGLYLNGGNRSDGTPIFAPVSKLAGDDLGSAELLVENFLFPRTRVQDSIARVGRRAQVAVAADFDNDGRTDLLVGNGLQGFFASHPKTQFMISPYVDAIGREVKKTYLPTTLPGLHFLEGYVPRDNRDDRRKSSRGVEYYGENSLFLNLGDQDGDGVPEWRDATQEAGIGGQHSTVSLLVADIDLDGDLDVFEANVVDLDFWPAWSKGWAGAPNKLYVNQLAETGTLVFKEKAAEMGVDGMFDAAYPMPAFYRLQKLPLLPYPYALLWYKIYGALTEVLPFLPPNTKIKGHQLKLEPFQPEVLAFNGQTGENAENAWASVFQDVNEDGYPDLWVANDFGFLRLYQNEGGTHFREAPHARDAQAGNWMSFAPGDFNGDLKEDLFVGNSGGAYYTKSFIMPHTGVMFEPSTGAACLIMGYVDKFDATHALINGANPLEELSRTVIHSRVLPPDASLQVNLKQIGLETTFRFERGGLDPYEFSWGATAFDAQNDGALDWYYFGNLISRGGGFFPVVGTNPGRFLANISNGTGALALQDLTAEHHLFNILEVRYDRLKDHGYIYRSAPLQNWRQRDVVNSYDRTTWTHQGPAIRSRVTNHSFIQTAENGRSTIAADLNGDGFEDLLLRNAGGYDSRSSNASNLKFQKDGRPHVLSAHDYNFPTLTNFEPGATRLLINKYQQGNWIEVHLVDDSPSSYNRAGIGARVVVNGRYLRVKRSGSGSSFSNRLTDVRIGLGKETATQIQVHWPDRERTVTEQALPKVKNGRLTVFKTTGKVVWQPQGSVSDRQTDASHLQRTGFIKQSEHNLNE